VLILLLIMGLCTLARLRAAESLTSAQFPWADPQAFAVWHRAEIKARAWLVAASLGVAAVSIAVLLVVAAVMRSRGVTFYDVTIRLMPASQFCIIPFAVMIVIAAAHGSKAKRFRDLAGIHWPNPDPKDRCPTCHYDRTGLAAGVVCPECGKLPA
jgi:hypothetical protein